MHPTRRAWLVGGAVGGVAVAAWCSPALVLLAGSVAVFACCCRLAWPQSALLDDGVAPATDGTLDLRRALAAVDPTFSEFLFEDFVRTVYRTWLQARAAGDAGAVARAKLAAHASATGPAESGAVNQIHVGVLAVVDLDVGTEWTTCRCFVAADFEVDGDGAWYVEDVLTLRRPTGVPSPGVLAMRTLSSPTGWELTDVQRRLRQRRDEADRVLPSPRREVPERPPCMADDFFGARRDFMARNPTFKPGEFKELAAMLFIDHQKAWSALRWEAMAPVQTATFHGTRLFWVRRYRRRGVTPHADDAVVRRMTLVRIGHDAWFDWITVRVAAASTEYAVAADGTVVMGERDGTVNYREYWTFLRVRRYGVAAVEEPRCPGCTGPLGEKPGDVCRFCGTELAGLELDWSVARVDCEEDYGPSAAQ